jgi:hypothetical protein
MSARPLVESFMKLLGFTSFFGIAALVGGAAACSSGSEPPLAPETTRPALAPEPALDAAPAVPPPVGTGPTAKGDASRPAGDPKCVDRCTKAACADLDTCVERCEDSMTTVSAACMKLFDAAIACIDTKGHWACKEGEAKGTGPCGPEGMALLNCAFGSVDAGAPDAAVDAGL